MALILFKNDLDFWIDHDCQGIGTPFSVAKYRPGATNDSERRSIVLMLCQGCVDLEPVQNLRRFYRVSIEEHADWLIQEIANVIDYIDMRYGSRDRLL